MRRLAIVLSLVVAACGGTTGTNPPGAGATSVADTPTANRIVTPAPSVVAFAAITLTGTGKRVVKFAVPEGAASIAEAAYDGAHTFAITSIAADGSTNDLLVNTIGAYAGTVLFDASDEHTVAFEIDAAGPWTIIVKPVSSARIWDGAATLTGTGDDVVRISPASSGLVTLDLAYQGKHNFAVMAFSGDESELLANEIGPFTGQVLLPDGSMLLTVRAAGPWSATPG